MVLKLHIQHEQTAVFHYSKIQPGRESEIAAARIIKSIFFHNQNLDEILHGATVELLAYKIYKVNKTC